ncbi:MAG: SLBB domain-containing protein [Muribaculaceae bacterium]|nr:SLBB domain-containing protein [Muribaculaceae bacterium]
MKLRTLIPAVFLGLALTAAALTDDEVIRYIRTQSANGKTEQQIGIELSQMGVRPDQVRRIKGRYSKEGTEAVGTPVPAQTAAITDNGRDLPPETAVQDSRGVVDVFAPDRDQAAREVYGHDLFNSRSLSFAPSNNLATPKNYRLGPGDEVIIDLWGAAEEHLREKISPEGSIMISRLGPVHLNGKTIDEANTYIRNLFAKKYAGVGSDQTDVSVNLGDVRSIQVDIMGEVDTPGTFRMSPFSTVFHALYNAGGINNIGSMRNIYVLRNGKKVATVDIYDYLFKGKQTGNIKLQEGDVIIVPPYDQIVNISGNVKRPMYYEIKNGETVASLLDYAGGMSGDAYDGMIRLSRQNGTENELYNIDKGEFNSYRLKDGDVVTVGTVLDRFTNRVELKGAVTRPGLYALGSGASTVSELIRMAEGLTDDAYQGRALLYRQGPDLTLEVIPFDLGALMSGAAADMRLQKNDVIEIASVQAIEERGDFTIAGMVTTPGNYAYMENTSVEDLILRAGGLREGASTARVDIARRIVNPTSMFETSQIAETFSIDIYNGLGQKNNPASEFILKPYDRVTVRKAPGYGAQKQVIIDGEVLFPGSYTLSNRNERISDLVNRCGGTVDGAYLKGAYLKRRLSEDEIQARANVMRLAVQNQESEDSISMAKLNVSSVYNVGINLPMALANPGSTYDLVLREGDYIFVPEYQSTVKISGDVMYPNTVVFVPNQKVSYYIDQAGGYGENAKKKKTFIVYMNGEVAKVKRSTKVEPGSTIIVPSKPESTGANWERLLTLVSGFGSVATMAATVAALFKK